MSGINKVIAFTVNRLRVTFIDESQNEKPISGTGFWVKLNSCREIFVTNKHNIDPTLKLGTNTKFRLNEVEIELRKKENNKVFCNTKFFRVINAKDSIIVSSKADCAIIVSPKFENLESNYQIISTVIRQNDLADHNFLKEKTQIMDLASFIGFAGTNDAKYWDQKWNMPIASLCIISSWPEIKFTHPEIKTVNTALVSGLSFSGSSGSPLILHAKGIEIGAELDSTPYVPPKVIGIMSGHCQESSNLPKLLEHSGLSYYTRSTSILRLINKHKL